MRRRILFCTVACFLLLAMLMPFAMLAVGSFVLSPQYDDTFLGALGDKYDRLYAIKQPKLVVIGGSSTAFGLDSALLEQHMKMPVVNFGLYATLGTKIMLDLARDAIGEGDIIILAPETDSQTLSLYFNAEAMWQACDGAFQMLKHVDSADRGDMVGALFAFASKKTGYWLKGKPNPSGVYRHDSFNRYGDIAYERPHNIMRLGYDPNMMMTFSTAMFSSDFIDYVNVYIDEAKKKGATVYYSFPPINESAIANDVTEETIRAYYEYVSQNINCDVISNIHDYIIEENYFYDSNFHLNDSGVILRTANLIKDLKRVQGDTVRPDIAIPPAPQRIPVGGEMVDGDNRYADCFLYEAFEDGLMIVGVTEEAKLLKYLTIPSQYDGKPVLALGEAALAGCSALKEVTINANIIQFYDAVFEGCTSLKKLHMCYESAEGIGVGSKLFQGAPKEAKMYFSSKAGYESFVSDYFWGPYGANEDRIKPAY